MSRVKFGDVVKDVKINIDRLNNPYEYYVAGDHMDSEDLTIHRKGCFTTDDVGPAFIRVFKPGQILYGSRRTYLKKIAVADFEGVCANTTFVFETKDPHAFEQRLLPFIMLSKDFTTWSIAKSKGSTNPYVLFSDLADFEFELPPLEEQKVLVDKLWAAYRLKEAYKKLLVATDEMVKSQFIEMFGNPLSLNQKNELKRLGECCILNPRRPNIALCDTDKVSFIPMPAVSEDGYLVDMTDEEYGKVKKGFTYFENNDVLFAKITPCMENGKGAIVHGLTNGIGMGSTEFHVLRPINGISSPYWLLALTRMPIFRERAAKNMSGTGGQKRVSASYLDHFMVGLPAIEEQRRFEAIYRQADKSKFGDFKSQFIEMFGNPVTNTKGWKTAKIKDVAPEMPSKEQLSGKIWLLNLDMIESNTGRIIEKVYEDVENALSVQSFDEGNVLFSKLRPYLNKVVIPDEPGMATTELVPLRPEPSKLHKVFLSHLLRGNQFVNYANDIAGGTKMPRMPLTELRNFDCILPPMDKQLEFVFIAEQADKSKFGDFKSQFIEMFGNPLSLNQKNELKRLGECCILNPRRPNIALCDTDKVSFIPMPAVSEDGYLVDMTDEEYGKVKKGFTYFENNDVLFAKITPCMENGKGAIVHGLTNGIGMGSTEFHVLRPINGISSPYWLLALTRMPIFRERAAKNMSGTGGQKRVSASYLDHFMVGLPAIEEQRRFEAIYKQADKSKFELKQCIENIDKVIKSLING